MDPMAAWKAAKSAQVGDALEVEGVSISWEVAAALRSYPEPRLERGEMVFAKGPSPRRRLVVMAGVAVLEVV